MIKQAFLQNFEIIRRSKGKGERGETRGNRKEEEFKREGNERKEGLRGEGGRKLSNWSRLFDVPFFFIICVFLHTKKNK